MGLAWGESAHRSLGRLGPMEEPLAGPDDGTAQQHRPLEGGPCTFCRNCIGAASHPGYRSARARALRGSLLTATDGMIATRAPGDMLWLSGGEFRMGSD